MYFFRYIVSAGRHCLFPKEPSPGMSIRSMVVAFSAFPQHTFTDSNLYELRYRRCIAKVQTNGERIEVDWKRKLNYEKRGNE